MSGTETLGNDPKWSAAVRNLASAVIAGAPPSAQAAICTIFGAIETFDCTVEYDTGMADLTESVYRAAFEVVGVWSGHNSNFPGLTFCLLKQPDGDWQINIDFAGQAENAVPGDSQEKVDRNQGAAQSAQQEEGGNQNEESAEQGISGSRQPRSRSSRSAMVHEQTESSSLPWAKIALIAVGALVVLGGIGGVAYFISQKPRPVAKQSIEQTRKGFETALTKQIEAPQEYDNDAPDAVKEVEYPSAGKQLKAWLVLPNREPPFPAVVFVHDGFALSRGDYDSALPFVQQGFAVLIPSFRGENGNPGNFEMCYGEVDDLVNAIEYLATRKKVDPKSIFAAGQGVGGTNVMLAAELSPHLRKAVACGGRPDMGEAGATYDHAPFNSHDLKELSMRSPARFVDDLKCPILLIYAEKEPADKLFQEQAKKMEKESKKEVILVEELAGETHQSALAPAISRMLRFFQAR